MMTRKNLIVLASASLVIFGCKPKFDDLEIKAGSADYSTYVAIGNSLTAGYADGALYKSGQTNSFPNMLQEQMALAGGGSFSIPYMNDEFGAMTANGADLPGFGAKMVLGTSVNCLGESGAGPIVASTNARTEVLNNIYSSKGPFNNLGIPGAKVTHVEFNGYGNPANLTLGAANPYFVRMASSVNASMLEDALAQSPTFFSLWIGNNDILGHSTAGGVIPYTDVAVFETAYNSIVDKLVASGATGVLANVPNVTSIPFFTTVPYNAVPLDAGSASNTSLIFGNIANYVDSVYGSGKGDVYRINFTEGPTPFFVGTADLSKYPLGFRQIEPNELVLLTFPQDSLRCGGYGFFNSSGYLPTEPITKTISRIRPLYNQHWLSTKEISTIETVTNSFNNIIKAAADKHNLAHADMHTHLSAIKEKGVTFNEVTYTTSYVTGGAFSLDGVHLTPRGYAIVANHFIDAINSKYTSTLPKVNVNTYPGLDLP
jgi:lysophospholipase L1-like esterase